MVDSGSEWYGSDWFPTSDLWCSPPSQLWKEKLPLLDCMVFRCWLCAATAATVSGDGGIVPVLNEFSDSDISPALYCPPDRDVSFGWGVDLVFDDSFGSRVSSLL